jgi:hypothetical protein
VVRSWEDIGLELLVGESEGVGDAGDAGVSVVVSVKGWWYSLVKDDIGEASDGVGDVGDVGWPVFGEEEGEEDAACSSSKAAVYVSVPGLALKRRDAEQRSVAGGAASGATFVVRGDAVLDSGVVVSEFVVCVFLHVELARVDGLETNGKASEVTASEGCDHMSVDGGG